jgi:hypothetical protein
VARPFGATDEDRGAGAEQGVKERFLFFDLCVENTNRRSASTMAPMPVSREFTHTKLTSNDSIVFKTR